MENVISQSGMNLDTHENSGGKRLYKENDKFKIDMISFAYKNKKLLQLLFDKAYYSKDEQMCVNQKAKLR